MEGSSSNAGAVIPFDVVDDFYFSALFEDDKVFPISDEKYSEELQLQEVLVSSKGSLSGRDVPREEEEPEPRLQSNKGKGRYHEAGSSSFFCGICMDRKPSSQVFRTGACSHVFCVDCIGTYVATRIRESITHVECPEDKCPAVLEPYICRPIIPAEVFDRWENVLCESLILGSQKFYCPFKDCSSLLIDDGGDVVTASECPICRRLFCAQCKVAWHSGLNCEGFRRAKEENATDMELDTLAIKLAESKKWRKCPKCNFYVERIDGCLHITCRCGFHFCYRCGHNWNNRHYNLNVGTYMATRIQENVTSIKCPEEKCQAILDPQAYLQIIPRDVAELWDRALCESLIPDSQKYYCPFRNCSALLVDDRGQVLTSCQCPICKRLFCVQCKVPWHSGLNCKEFQRAKDSDLDRMATDLAKSRQWKQCPNCNFYIEKSSGCCHMTCRCGLRFFYACGKKDCSCVFFFRR